MCKLHFYPHAQSHLTKQQDDKKHDLMDTPVKGQPVDVFHQNNSRWNKQLCKVVWVNTICLVPVKLDSGLAQQVDWFLCIHVLPGKKQRTEMLEVWSIITNVKMLTPHHPPLHKLAQNKLNAAAPTPDQKIPIHSKQCLSEHLSPLRVSFPNKSYKHHTCAMPTYLCHLK